jgi:hypothetical protein
VESENRNGIWIDLFISMKPKSGTLMSSRQMQMGSIFLAFKDPVIINNYYN